MVKPAGRAEGDSALTVRTRTGSRWTSWYLCCGTASRTCCRRGPSTSSGYGIDFDDRGVNGDHSIDFDALAAHLHHLDRAAEANGLAIEVVILAPNLQDELAAAEHGRALVRRLRFSRNPSWVRHDDHYHVDFRLVGT